MARDDELIRAHLLKDIPDQTSAHVLETQEHLPVGTVAISRVLNRHGGYRNFIGIIQSIAGDDYEVLFLKEKSPTSFTLSGRPDIAWIPKGDILGAVSDYFID